MITRNLKLTGVADTTVQGVINMELVFLEQYNRTRIEPLSSDSSAAHIFQTTELVFMQLQFRAGSRERNLLGILTGWLKW
jgi:hypothetical protein